MKETKWRSQVVARFRSEEENGEDVEKKSTCGWFGGCNERDGEDARMKKKQKGKKEKKREKGGGVGGAVRSMQTASMHLF